MIIFLLMLMKSEALVGIMDLLNGRRINYSHNELTPSGKGNHLDKVEAEKATVFCALLSCSSDFSTCFVCVCV
jgi:hypothetical protein